MTDSTLSAVLCVRNLRRAKHRAAPSAVTWLFASGVVGPLGCGLEVAAKRCLADIFEREGLILFDGPLFL